LAGYIPEHIIALVQASTDIVDIVCAHVHLAEGGPNLVGGCPFCGEAAPSFAVSPKKQIFHCFGCKEGGTVFRFLMLQEGMGFPEAVRYLANLNGIEILDAPGGDG